MKNYVHSLKSYITGANGAQIFGQEEELLFWATAAEIFSREDGPTFSAVVEWIDQVLQVPVHFVYQLTDPATLTLKRRLLVQENVRSTSGNGKSELKVLGSTAKEHSLADEIEQLQNTVTFDPAFEEEGVMYCSVGICMLIPLRAEGNLWGFYGAGPEVVVPEAMVQKMNIVRRLLARMIITISDKDRKHEGAYRDNLTDNLKGLEPTRVDIPKIYQYLLEVWSKLADVQAAAIIREDKGIPNITIQYQVAPEIRKLILERYRKLDKISTNELLPEGGETNGEITSHRWISIERDNWKGGIMLFQKESEPPSDYQYLVDIIIKMIEFKALNDNMINVISDFYYKLRRQQEEENPKTQFHTLRVTKLSVAVGKAMGLSEEECEVIRTTARLHDIGYLGSLPIEEKQSIGAELEHPYAGNLMLECLSVPSDITGGVKAHHEWIDGSGPLGMKGDEIPWTGKLMAISEFIVEYLEDHYDPVGKSGYSREDHENLKSELLRRTGKQFDMLLIPTTLSVLDQLGSEGLLTLGVDAR